MRNWEIDLNIPAIIPNLTRDIRKIFSENLNPAPRMRERVVLAILLLFAEQSPHSQYYRWNLLFRDFSTTELDQNQKIGLPDGTTIMIPMEAIRYVEEVLWLRPLFLANNLKEKPGNMHLLFERLCQLNENQHYWSKASIERSHTKTPIIESFFKEVAHILANQRQRLGERYGDISKRRRVEFGPFWLTAMHSMAVVPEELSLDNVIEACPLPLQNGFADNQEFAKRLLRVIDALNRRYLWLRACGLKPENWLAKENPSIQQLKQLANLRKQAAKYDQEDENSFRKDVNAAYRKAFAHCLVEVGGKKLGGFATFQEWETDQIGFEMLHYGFASLSDIEQEWYKQHITNTHEPAEYTGLSDEQHEGIEMSGEEESSTEAKFDPAAPDDTDYAIILKDTYYRLPDLCPDVFSPIMRYYFQRVLSNAHNLQAQKAALTDPSFLRMVENDPDYWDLTEEVMLQSLWEDAEVLVMKNQKKWEPFL